METFFIGKSEADCPGFRLYSKAVEPFSRKLRDHRHTLFEIVLFESGSGLYDTQSGLHTLEKGSVFVFSSNEYHCIPVIYKGEILKFKLLQFSPDFFMTECADTDGEFDITVLQEHGTDFCNKLCGKLRDRAEEIICAITDELKQKKLGYARAVKNLLYEIILLLLRESNYMSFHFESSAIKTAVAYIDSHFCESISVNDIIRRANTNRNKLTELFVNTFGITVWEYVLRKRIEKSKFLLETERNIKIIDIATVCGFNSTAAFNKIFKKTTGITPSEYRKLQERTLI